MALRHKIRHWFKSSRTGLFVSPRRARRHSGTTIEQDNARQVAAREAMRSSESRRVDPN